MIFPQKRRSILFLPRRRHIQRRVPIKEIHRFERHRDDLARHDGEILHARHVLQSELDEDDEVGVGDVFVAAGPGAYAVAAPGLVCVFAARVEFAVVVFCDVDVVVGEFGAFVVEALGVGQEFLEGGGDDFVADWFSVDGVFDGGILDFEHPVGIGVEVEAARILDEGLRDGVADTVRVEV